MIKKILFLFVCFFFCSVAFAQNIISGDVVPTEISVSPKPNPRAVNDLNHINVKFCDSALISTLDNLSLVLRPNQKRKICVVALSSADNLAITPSIVSASQGQNGMVCDSTASEYSGVFDSDWMNQKISLESGKQDVRFFSLDTESLGTGSYDFCLSWKLAGYDVLQTGEMFLVEFRKALPIGLIISGGTYYFQWRDDLLSNKVIIFRFLMCIIVLLLFFEFLKLFKHKK